MPREESHYPADWRRIAEKDLRRAEHLLDIHDAEAAGFYLQQAVEKFLKAFLLSKGWKLERIHDLEALLNDALTYDSSLEEFRLACQKITAFYFVERYPFVTGTGLTEDDVRSSREQVRQLIEKLRTETTQEEE
jgi:HEPN domain-containing protein